MADTGHHHHDHGVHASGHVSAHNPGAGQGPVVLDIGEDVGALVLHARDDMVGREIHISPAGQDDDRSHVEVLPRTTPSGAVRPTAVFGSLTQGRWTLWGTDGVAALVVTVVGGQVAEADWPVDAA